MLFAGKKSARKLQANIILPRTHACNPFLEEMGVEYAKASNFDKQADDEIKHKKNWDFPSNDSGIEGEVSEKCVAESSLWDSAWK
jgi:hypothetical protein